MKTPTAVFIIVMVLVLLLGTYLIVKANKPEVVTPAATPSEPTANIWTVVGGIMDIFKKDDEEEGPVEESETFGKPGGTFGPPQA